uniref:Uncharacterized protein n=1 Tax=Arundo donax TaxID=35708 RepID=A0A0A9BXQ3_ARUDO
MNAYLFIFSPYLFISFSCPCYQFYCKSFNEAQQRWSQLEPYNK